MATPEVPRRDLAWQGGGRVTSGPSEVAQRGPPELYRGLVAWRGALPSRAAPVHPIFCGPPPSVARKSSAKGLR